MTTTNRITAGVVLACALILALAACTPDYDGECGGQISKVSGVYYWKPNLKATPRPIRSLENDGEFIRFVDEYGVHLGCVNNRNLREFTPIPN